MKINNIISTIRELKKIGAVAIKQSFEDEGANYDEVKLMNEIVKKVNLDHNIKIAGCEAKNDINFCSDLRVDGIVAPMVESNYALTKFMQSIPKNNSAKLYVNIETYSAINDIKKILSSKNLNRLNGLVFGRSDIAGSLGLEKKDVNSKKITNLITGAIKYAKKKKSKLKIKIGGSISFPSKNVIENLFKKKLINSYETRNIEIKISKNNLNKLDEILKLAFKLEIEWNKFKIKNQKIHLNLSQKEFLKKRIKEIKSRLI